MKFSQDKCTALALVKKNPAIKHSLRTDCLGSISAGEDLRILGSIRLRMSQ